ncbi:LysR family transcriptional regulator [Pseudonocardia sp. NPDC049635]|uniref:LysR family transcriptional regulator n=1 Tax=Pseudonocardia sp. NPDC049635 TaxID=3155506 RepID=UPI0033C23235
MIKPLHLATLRAVCRHGSFALAARDLGYTASAVSQQVAALEKDTGLTLFEREARGIRTTAAAERLVELSGTVLATLDELDHQVRELAAGSTGRLRLGSFPTGSVRLVPAALSTIAAVRPRADIQLEEGEPDELIPSLVAGELDLALVYEYALSRGRWPEGVVVRPLVREELVLLQPKGSPAAEVSQLASARWVTSREGTAGARSLTRLCAAAGFTPDVSFRTNNYAVVRELVATRLGVAVVPALGHVPDERVHATRVGRRAAHRTVLAVHRAANSNPLLPEAVTILQRSIPADLPFLTRPALRRTGSGSPRRGPNSRKPRASR